MAAIVSTRHIALLHPPRLRCPLLMQLTSVRLPCWNCMTQVNLGRVMLCFRPSHRIHLFRKNGRNHFDPPYSSAPFPLPPGMSSPDLVYLCAPSLLEPYDPGQS